MRALPSLLVSLCLSLTALPDAADAQTSAPSRRSDTDRSCMTTRQAVLARDSLVEPVIRNCTVVGGRWEDAWTGVILERPSEAEVSHVVPVVASSDSGGQLWTAEQRHAFLNDPDNLAVTAAAGAKTMERKRSFGPAVWLPDDPTRRCIYMRRWLFVKTKYDLTASAAELDALRRAMATCGPEQNGSQAGQGDQARDRAGAPATASDLYR